MVYTTTVKWKTLPVKAALPLPTPFLFVSSFFGFSYFFSLFGFFFFFPPPHPPLFPFLFF